MNRLHPSIAKAQTLMFRMDGSKVTTSATAEEGENFRREVDYLHHFVVEVGAKLGMQMIDYAVFVEGGTRVGFRFNKCHGVQTAEINGLVSGAPLPIEAVLAELG